jgi:dipeptidyl-peptidase 4
VQNTLNLALRLQEAGKAFDLMLYPGNRHSVGNPRQRRHLYATMAQFVREHL